MYESTIKYSDFTIGELLKKIEKLFSLKDTIIVVCSDHGDEFMEKGNTGHKEKLIPELLRVPLLIYSDGKKKRIDSPVSLIQLPATILGVVGIKPPNLMQPGLLSGKLLEVKSEVVTKYEIVLSKVDYSSYQKIIIH